MKTVAMQFEKETKGAVQYKEVDASGKAKDQASSVIGTLYLRKSALEGTIPQVLTVTVEFA